MICPCCGQPAPRYRISQRMAEIARLPRPGARGSAEASQRAKKAVMARWQPVKQENKPSLKAMSQHQEPQLAWQLVCVPLRPTGPAQDAAFVAANASNGRQVLRHRLRQRYFL